MVAVWRPFGGHQSGLSLSLKNQNLIANVRVFFQGSDWHYETQLPDWARDDYVYPVQTEKRD